MPCVPHDLTQLDPSDLYQAMDDLRAHRAREGRGRSPGADHVRCYCRAEIARVQRELRRRDLPVRREGEGWEWRYSPLANKQAS